MNMKFILNNIAVGLSLASTVFAQKALIIEQDNFLFLIEENLFASLPIASDLFEHYKARFFDILSISDEQNDSTNKFLKYCGKNLPKLFAEYLLGNISSDQACAIAEKLILNETSFFSLERPIFLKAAKLAFNPKEELSLIKENIEILNYMAAYKQSGVKIILFSNKNHESLDMFKNKFSHWLNIFDRIVISEEIKFLKPEQSAYIAVLQLCNLDPKDCLFIESEESYADQAKSFGLQAIVYQHNVTNLTDELQAQHFFD